MSYEPNPERAVSDAARLIEAIAANRDREAFTRLFEHFAPRVKSLMLRSGATSGQAEELAQETLLMVWRKASLFDSARAAQPIDAEVAPRGARGQRRDEHGRCA